MIPEPATDKPNMGSNSKVPSPQENTSQQQENGVNVRREIDHIYRQLDGISKRLKRLKEAV